MLIIATPVAKRLASSLCTKKAREFHLLVCAVWETFFAICWCGVFT